MKLLNIYSGETKTYVHTKNIHSSFIYSSPKLEHQDVLQQVGS